jgi:hypothetical protein
VSVNQIRHVKILVENEGLSIAPVISPLWPPKMCYHSNILE